MDRFGFHSDIEGETAAKVGIGEGSDSRKSSAGTEGSSSTVRRTFGLVLDDEDDVKRALHAV